MAIQKYEGKKKTTYRVYWRNPVTKLREYKKFNDFLEAQKYDLEVRYRIKTDPLSFSPPKTGDGEVNFEEAAKLYLQKHEMAVSTKKAAYKTVQAEILPYIGKIKIRHLTKEDLKELVSAWKKKGNKQITIYRKMSYVTTILNWLEENENIPNPLPKFKVPKGEADVILPITEKEFSLLYDSAVSHLKRVLIIGANLGPRIGESELLKLKWDNVNWDEQSIIVESAKKGGVSYREVPLSNFVFKMFKKWWEEDFDPKIEHIVHYNGKPVHSIKKAWAGAKEKAGITRRLRPYDLRHLFATRALKAGADLKSVAEILGNDPRTLLKIYQHVLTDMKRKAVQDVGFKNFEHKAK